MVNRLVDAPELRRAMLAQLFTRHEGAGPGASLLPPDLRLGLIERLNERSRAFAAQRGYAPDIDAWRAGLAAERWTPDGPLDAELLRDISEARQIAESVISPRPMPTRRTVSAAVPARGALTLRVRPRPWVLNGLGWMARRLRPGFASRF